jgi:hypothetical protein
MHLAVEHTRYASRMHLADEICISKTRYASRMHLAVEYTLYDMLRVCILAMLRLLYATYSGYASRMHLIRLRMLPQTCEYAYTRRL